MTKAQARKAATKQGHLMLSWEKWGTMPRSYTGADTGRIGLYESVCGHCRCTIGIRGDGYVFHGEAMDVACGAAVAR